MKKVMNNEISHKKSSTEQPLHWASIGCGVMANELAQALQKRGHRLYGIANRTLSKAEEFADRYGVEKVYAQIDDVFADPNVDIIYISTPHNTHQPLIKKALAAGKHVLSEKAVTLNSEELDEAIALAEEKGLVFAEAMTIYHMPLYAKLKALIESGDFGPLKFIQINFGSYKDYDMTNRFFSRELAGGALLDIGVYALSLTRLFMSQTPANVRSQVSLAPTGVDEQAGILLMNDNGEMAALSLTLHAKQPKRAMLAYDKAYIEITDFPRGQAADIVWTEDGRRETVTAGSTADAVAYETADMEEAVLGGVNRMQLPLSKDVMDIMTALRNDWGVVYPEEEQQ